MQIGTGSSHRSLGSGRDGEEGATQARAEGRGLALLTPPHEGDALLNLTPAVAHSYQEKS